MRLTLHQKAMLLSMRSDVMGTEFEILHHEKRTALALVRRELIKFEEIGHEIVSGLASLTKAGHDKVKELRACTTTS